MHTKGLTGSSGRVWHKKNARARTAQIVCSRKSRPFRRNENSSRTSLEPGDLSSEPLNLPRSRSEVNRTIIDSEAKPSQRTEDLEERLSMRDDLDNGASHREQAPQASHSSNSSQSPPAFQQGLRDDVKIEFTDNEDDARSLTEDEVLTQDYLNSIGGGDWDEDPPGHRSGKLFNSHTMVP